MNVWLVKQGLMKSNAFSRLMGNISMREFGVLEDMEAKLHAKFNPSQLKVDDPNGDLYKVNVSESNCDCAI